METFNSGEHESSRYFDGDENSELDSLFCHAYGKCDNSCLLFGCAFEETEDMRNWSPNDPETDED